MVEVASPGPEARVVPKVAVQQATAASGLSSIDAAVTDASAEQLIPGAVVLVGRHDRVLFRRAYGEREVEPGLAAMTLDTVFDLASLTKPIATATSILILAERGALGLDDRLARYVPECADNGKRDITLRHLLLHVSGLPADLPASDFTRGRAEAIARICRLGLQAPPGVGSIYSDIGYVLLEEVVRRVSSRGLDDFAADSIFRPLGMKDTGYLPSEEQRDRAASTERVDGVWRVGVVHDPRAYLLNGVSGHAGLFSTGDDLAIFAQAILGCGEVAGRRVLSRSSVAALIAPQAVPGGVRALGWTVTSPWRGDGLSARAIGHFGFTGTALWIDPEKDLFTVVLTNRVHPTGMGDSKPLVARVNGIASEAVGSSLLCAASCEDGPPPARNFLDKWSW